MNNTLSPSWAATSAFLLLLYKSKKQN